LGKRLVWLITTVRRWGYVSCRKANNISASIASFLWESWF